MLTMWPPRSSRAAASCVPYMTPFTFTSITFEAASGFAPASEPTIMIPALFTSASSRPCSRMASSRKCSNESRSVTSRSGRSPTTTRAPRRESSSAVARPMPRAPPVMATTLSTPGPLSRQPGDRLDPAVRLDPQHPGRLPPTREPRRAQAGLRRPRDVPLVAGYQQHTLGCTAERERREPVEGRRGLVDLDLVGGQDVVEAIGEACVPDERRYAVARPVREDGQGRAPQRVEPGRD